MKIRQRLILGFVGVALLTGVVAGIAIKCITSIRNDIDEIALSDIGEIKVATEICHHIQGVESNISKLFLETIEERPAEIERAKRVIKRSVFEIEEIALDWEDAIKTGIKPAKTKAEELEAFKRLIKPNINDFVMFVGKAVSLHEGTRYEEAKEFFEYEVKLVSWELQDVIKGLEEDVRKGIIRAAEESRTTAEKALSYTFVGAVITFLMALGLGGLISRAITKPIAELKDAAVEIGGGELNTIVRIESKDEIGVLANSFNKMTATFSKMDADLKDRTTSIDNLNQEIGNLNQEIVNLNQEIGNLNQEQDNLDREKNTLDREKDNLTQERDNFTQEIDNLNREVDNLNREVTECKRAEEEIRAERERAEEEIRAERERAEEEIRAERERAEEEVRAERERAEEEVRVERERVEEEVRVERERAEEEVRAERERAEEDVRAEKERAEEEIRAERERAEEEIEAEKKKLQNIMESMMDGIIVTDMDGKIISINKATTEQFGYTKDEVIGKTPGELFIAEEDKLKFMEVLKESASGRTIINQEYQGKHKDGRRRFSVSFIFSVQRDVTGKPTAIIAVHRNIAKSKQAEEKARIFSVAVANAYDGIVVTDMNGNVAYANESALRIHGYTAGELCGLNISRWIRDPQVAENIMNETIKEGGWSGELAGKRKSNEEYPCIWSVSPVKDEQENIVGVLGVFRDLSEHRRDNQALRKAQYKLEVQSREHAAELARAQRGTETDDYAKSRFLVNLLHELHTPLESIISSSDLGVGKYTTMGSKKIHNCFANIQQSGNELLTLLNDVLDLTNLEFPMAAYDFRPTDLGVLIELVTDEFGSLASEQNLTIQYDKSDFDEQVTLDAEKVRQVLRNLLSNAVRFSPKGGVIEVSMRRVDDSVVVSVCDEGPGVPDGELKVAFDKFVQSSKAKSGESGIDSTGLELAICKEIIVGHNGHIWAENNAEAGAVFSFEIPLSLESVEENPALVGAESNSEVWQ